MINLSVLHPLAKRFEWNDLPSEVKEAAEIRKYGLASIENAYEIYGASSDEGMIAVIRPDGYIGMFAPLSAPSLVEIYFSSCLIRA